MPAILLDSSAIFDTLNGKRKRREYLERLIGEGYLLACCAVNFTEVYAGLRDHERPVTERFLNSLEFYPVTAEVAKYAGLLKREWQQKGRTLSYTDVMLAAVAIRNDLAFLTDNRKDFPMPELRLHPLP